MFRSLHKVHEQAYVVGVDTDNVDSVSQDFVQYVPERSSAPGRQLDKWLKTRQGLPPKFPYCYQATHLFLVQGMSQGK